jgi:hypothetical protein
MDGHLSRSLVFHPNGVFDELYLETCRSAFRCSKFADVNDNQILLPSGFVKLVKNGFLSLFTQLGRNKDATAASVHRQTLHHHRLSLTGIDDPTLDLICIHRLPEHVLPCGHRICDLCLQTYWRESDIYDFEFNVAECVLCALSFPPVKIKLHDPCRGLNVLSLDGGGCRSIMQLVFLRTLEQCLGLPYPIQEHYDVVIGSSGGKSHELYGSIV